MTVISQKALANELGLTTRRIRQLEAEGVLTEEPDGRYDLEWSRRAYDVFRERDYYEIERIGREAEALSRDLELGLAKIGRAPKPRRWEIAEAVGPSIGAIDARLRLLAALGKSDAERALLRQHADALTGRAVTALFDLLGVAGIAAPEAAA